MVEAQNLQGEYYFSAENKPDNYTTDSLLHSRNWFRF